MDTLLTNKRILVAGGGGFIGGQYKYRWGDMEIINLFFMLFIKNQFMILNLVKIFILTK